MFSLVETGQVRVPLWDTAKVNTPNMSNQSFLRDYVMNLLSTAFPNVSKYGSRRFNCVIPPDVFNFCRERVRSFVLGLFDLNKDLNSFKQHLRDYLVQLKEFEGDNSELFLEETEKVRPCVVVSASCLCLLDTTAPSLQEMAKVESERGQKELAIPGMVPQHNPRREMED